MRFWQSISRILVGAVLGLCLVMTLHACQTAEVTSVASTPIPSTSPDAAVPLTPSPTPLPPATQAIVDQVGNLDNPPRGQVRLAVISDLNSAYGSTDYEPEVDQGIALLPFWQPDLVVCGGDMIAGQNASLTTSEIQAMWAAFDQHIAAPLRQANLPLGFTIGNHDASGARSSDGQFLFQQERELATAYWNTPDHDPGVQFIDRTQFPFYYTFSFNDVFFLVWDGSSSQIPTEKLAWVEQALSSQQAQQAKLRILVGHLPLYGVAIGRDKPGEVMENADQLRMMLERYNVHTYISGHHHAYYPAHKGKMQLLHTGILGAGPRPLIAGDRPPQKTITIVDINFDTPDLTTYTTYDMQTLQPIAMEDLPRFLDGHNGRVLRRDVQPEDLTAEEQSMCEQQLG
ncbi:MAG TPA: metallophosphoesterase, partial [Allocoleopsis sp.]